MSRRGLQHYREHKMKPGERIVERLGPNRNWPDVDIEVESDGRTVWVNAPICIGRFCKSSGEIFCIPKDRQAGSDAFFEFQEKASWSWWTRRMFTAHGLTIPDKFKPEWARP
jgi:hypothetical protein